MVRCYNAKEAYIWVKQPTAFLSCSRFSPPLILLVFFIWAWLMVLFGVLLWRPWYNATRYSLMSYWAISMGTYIRKRRLLLQSATQRAVSNINEQKSTGEGNIWIRLGARQGSVSGRCSFPCLGFVQVSVSCWRKLETRWQTNGPFNTLINPK